MNSISIAKRIKEYRTERKLTQEGFAKLLGVSPQAVSKWERETCYPDITFLPKIAKLLECTVNDFFD